MTPFEGGNPANTTDMPSSGIAPVLALGLVAVLPALSVAFSPLVSPHASLRSGVSSRTCALSARAAVRPLRSPALLRMSATADDAAALLEENPNALLNEARDGNLEMVKQLIALGADSGAADWKGRTGLHYAAEKGHDEIAMALMDAGAKLDAKTTDGLTPLHCASWIPEDPALALAMVRRAHPPARSPAAAGAPQAGTWRGDHPSSFQGDRASFRVGQRA